MFSEYVVRAVVDDHVGRLQHEAAAHRMAQVAVRTMSEPRPQRTAVGRVLRSLDRHGLRTGAQRTVALHSGQPQPCG